MTSYSNQLLELQVQIAEKEHIETKLHNLRTQKEDLEYSVSKLSYEKTLENEDVENLEGGSLLGFILRLTGGYEKRLSKEQQEAYAATVKYDTAVSELEAVELDIRHCEGELARIRSREREYEKLLQERKEALAQSDTPAGEEIRRLQDTIASQTARKKELLEAIEAGNRAKGIADQVGEHLSEASSWGTFDLLGGGLLSDLAKHDHIDQAQKLVEALQVQLRRFNTELADVNQRIDATPVVIDSFTKFADFFFDDIFSSLSVSKKIDTSIGNLNQTRLQIERMLERLQPMLDQTEQNIKNAQFALENLVRTSN
mgnify:CR=1 FL=1